MDAGSNPSWERLERLFHEALAHPCGQREGFLDGACADDAPLRRRLELLLEAHDTPSSNWDDQPPTGVGLFAPGEVVGRFRVVRLIGAGGAGAVYEAVQDRPSRAVALKVLALPSPTAWRRFDRESEVLARLGHPGIARVYDAGLLEAGARRVPFIAMELIPGARPITVAAQGLEPRARVDLLARVCDAVHHAHAKGVIHLDLKPANILVDGDGNPKVIDFGIARANDPELTLATGGIRPGQILGTLAYMSPEQAVGDRDSLDTRSDVYALGAVLHELLAGSPVFDLRRVSIPEALRIVREQEPPRLGAFDRSLRGDLELIAGKALRKDADKRYQTAAELGQDLRRHLRHEAVGARAPSAAYRFSRFARRNRALAVAGAAVTIILAAALPTMTMLYLSAESARQDSNSDRDRAREEAATAAAVLEFLTTMLAAADPVHARGESLTVREVLDAAAPQLATRFGDRPAVRATLERTIGGTYESLGVLDRAAPHLRAAYEIERDAGPERRLAASDDAVRLASLLWKTGESPEGERMVMAEIAYLEDLETPEHDRLARALLHAGKMKVHMAPEQGMPLLTRAIDLARQDPGVDRHTLAGALDAMGSSLGSIGRSQEAISYFEESITILRTIDPEGPDLPPRIGNLAGEYRRMRLPDRALPLIIEAADRAAATLGPDHRTTGILLVNKGDLLGEVGRHEEALESYLAGRAVLERHYGRPHGNVAVARLKTGRTLLQLGDAADARTEFETARRVLEEAGSADAFVLALMDEGLGVALTDLGEFERALALLEDAAGRIRAGHSGRPDATRAHREAAISRCLEGLGRGPEAAARLERAWDRSDEIERGILAERLAQVHEGLGDAETAESWRRCGTSPDR